MLSRKGARFSTIDLKNFYLDTPMPDPEYVRIKMTDIPDEFIEEYNLIGRDRDGWVYFEIRQGCYGLPQSGILANNLLRSRLVAEGFYESFPTPGLWRHKWQPLQFSLIVDDFGVEYVGIEHFTSYLIFSRSTTECNLTWPATNSQVLLSHGTTQTGIAASACPGTLTICSSNSSIRGL